MKYIYKKFKNQLLDRYERLASSRIFIVCLGHIHINYILIVQTG